MSDARHASLVLLPGRPLGADGEALQRIAALAGLPERDVRWRARVGRPMVLTRSSDRAELQTMRDGLRALGHAAVLVDDNEIREARFPLAARGVRIESDAVAFLDHDGRELAILRACEEALIVVANLASRGESPFAWTHRSRDASSAERIYKETELRLTRLLTLAPRDFVLDLAWSGSEERVRLRCGNFHFGTLGDLAGPSVTGNMRTLIDRIVRLVERPVLDAAFDHSGMPRTPGFAPHAAGRRHRVRPRRRIEDHFESYCRQLGAAWKAGLLRGLLQADRPPGQAYFPAQVGTDVADEPQGAPPAPPPREEGDGVTTWRERRLARLRRWGPPAIVIPIAIFGGGVSSLLGAKGSPLAVAVAVAALGLLGITHGLALFARKRLIENVPTSKARSAALGLCEISGRTRAIRPLVTPFSLMPCVYYEYRIESRDPVASERRRGAETRGGGSGGAFVQTGCSGEVPFLVEDDTGALEVDPRGAIVSVSTEQTLFTPPFDGSLARAETTVKVHERYIPIDHPVYVMGELRQVAAAPARRREEMASLFRELKNDERRLAACDIDGDGVIDSDEWSIARRDVERIWLARRAAGDGRSDRIVMGCPATPDLFFITERSEAGTLGHLSARSKLSVAIGAALCVAASLLILAGAGR